jgi:hypothetical protein
MLESVSRPILAAQMATVQYIVTLSRTGITNRLYYPQMGTVITNE